MTAPKALRLLRSSLPNGRRVPRYAGSPSFAHLPHTQDLTNVDVAIVGVPVVGGAGTSPGTSLAPRHIRQHSHVLRPFDLSQDVEPFHTLRVVDFGDAPCNPLDVDDAFASAEETVSAIVRAGALPVILGGDHSIGLPVLRALSKTHGPVGVIHFDAHHDLWPDHFDRACPHATQFRRAIEEGIVDPRRYLQIGLRGSLPTGSKLDEINSLGVKLLTTEEVLAEGLSAAIRGMHSLGAGPIHVSLDIDVVDPTYAPGTGTPEVAGLTSREIVALVRGQRGLPCVGFDLVEVCPAYDHAGITSMLAANLVYEFIATRVPLAGRHNGRIGPAGRVATGADHENWGNVPRWGA